MVVVIIVIRGLTTKTMPPSGGSGLPMPLHLMCASLPPPESPAAWSKSPFLLHSLFSPAGILLRGLTQIPSPEPGEPQHLLGLLVPTPSSPGAPSLLPAPCTGIPSPYHSRRGTDRFVKNVLGSPTNSALPLYPDEAHPTARGACPEEEAHPPMANEYLNGAHKNIFLLLLLFSLNSHYVIANPSEEGERGQVPLLPDFNKAL